MLQSALEDRFQLKIHRDAEEVPMYNLTVARGGLKLKPMEPGGCFEPDPSKGTFTSEILPPGQKPMCTVWLHVSGPDWVLDAPGQKPGNLTGMLWRSLKWTAASKPPPFNSAAPLKKGRKTVQALGSTSSCVFSEPKYTGHP